MAIEITWGRGAGKQRPELLDQRPPTMAEMITKRVAATPDSEAFRYPVAEASGERWDSVTWAEVGKRSKALAAGLISLGIEPEQRVAIASTTRYDWILADYAAMLAGAATTTVYPTTTPDEVAFILSDSGSCLVFAEDDDQIEKIVSHREGLPEVKWIVTFDGKPDPDGAIPVVSLSDLEARGGKHLEKNPDAIEKAMAAIGPDSLATLIYTSGTTGTPKGVRLTHECWTYEGACIDAVNLLTKDHFQYLWLPLSHSFAKVLESAQLQIGFATAIDGRVDKIIDNLAVVKPVWMCAAPRVFEKAYGRIVTMVEQEGGVKAKLFKWAFGVGKQVSQLRQQGEEPSGSLAVKYRLADKLVFSKIRARFGGNMAFMVSGAAALNREIAEWFHAAGILILEGYGLTETGAGTCVNLPGIFRFGTVGPPFPGTEVKIGEDGEVLVRGPGVMRGYHNRPDLDSEIDEDGFFHTGDIGEFTNEGHVRITDRKKDLFKTSGGKYIAPSAIESMFKVICPYVSQIIVHGENRKFVSALITLDPDAVATLAEHEGITGKSYTELVNSDYARKKVQEGIDQLNATLNRWETIKKFVILDQDLSVESGGMTPSLKVKRKAVEQQYADVLEGFYA